jgi:hypothetical protein
VTKNVIVDSHVITNHDMYKHISDLGVAFGILDIDCLLTAWLT